MKELSKKATILMALKNGERLTAAKGYAIAGTMRIAAVVFALRSEGYTIVREDRHDINGTVFTEYFMPDSIFTH